MVSYCPKCQTKTLTTDARFCSACGAKFLEAETPTPAGDVTATEKPKATGASNLVLGLLFAVLGLGVVAKFMLALGGIPPDPQDNSGLAFWSAVAFAVLFRRWGKSGWLGALAGIAAAFVFATSMHLVAHYNESDARKAMRSPPFPAIKKFDPAAYQQMQTVFESVEKDKSLTYEAKISRVQALVVPILIRAVKQTSSEALVRYTEVRVATYEEVARANAGDCVALITGEAKPDVAIRMRTYQSAGNREATSAAMSSVIEEAANKTGHFELSEKESSDLMSRIETKLAERGLSTEYILGEKRTGTMEQQCQSGIHLFRESLRLPEPARSGFLRYLIAG